MGVKPIRAWEISNESNGLFFRFFSPRINRYFVDEYFNLMILKKRISDKFKCTTCSEFLKLDIPEYEPNIKVTNFKAYPSILFAESVNFRLTLICKCKNKKAFEYRFVGNDDEAFNCLTVNVGRDFRHLRMKYGGNHSKNDYKDLWLKQMGKCFYCEKILAKEYTRSSFEVDHLIPLCFGGLNTPINLRLA